MFILLFVLNVKKTISDPKIQSFPIDCPSHLNIHCRFHSCQIFDLTKIAIVIFAHLKKNKRSKKKDMTIKLEIIINKIYYTIISLPEIPLVLTMKKAKKNMPPVKCYDNYVLIREERNKATEFRDETCI